MDCNLPQVINRVTVKLDSFRNPDQMLRAMALATLSNMHKRIHMDGKASDGSQIGIYSPAYLAVRSGNYRNATRLKRGEKAGLHKDKKKKGEAGVHIKGRSTGSSRPTYNRGTDPKVILSLTRQMENDMKVIAITNGYSIGYSNPLNMQKAKWAEATYNKRIFSLTTQEQQTIRDISMQYLKEVK